MDLTSIENFRKQNKITTRKFAEMCRMTPSRYCDLKFNREKPTVQEGSNIINAVVKIKMKDSQCNTCCEYKDRECTRVGINGEIGVCWMEKSEGEY
ncbi:hypothetical protein ACFLKC_14155 [Clostridium caseinilyticum]|uniref:hypothetical protein n=1 Tax=Clostridium caseinilyticum TaxID=3350403 RepID=UPI0038F5E2D7